MTPRLWCACLAALLLTAGVETSSAQQPQLTVDPPEVRALWVDAFHAGIRSTQEAEALVAAAKRANLNTLFVQVRRRGDALYTKGIEPPLDDPAYDPSFDALASIVDLGHRAGLEVHAWVNAMPVWRDETPPKDPRHVFNQHGPSQPGDDNWFTASPAGNHKFPVGYFLDPGHPAAAAYLAGIYLDIVRNYDVDGIHFDYIRYPETDERSPRGAPVGYNAVSLARFQKMTARPDVPAPGDEQWIAWRREQVTNLVRRISIEAKAVKPRIKISAALIPWGQPPTSEQNFSDVAPMQRVFQDWHGWLKDGLLDLGVPMNYARETDDRVRGWFNGWIGWEKKHEHGRQIAVGLGAYLNAPENTLAQIARVRKARGKNRVYGVSFFSYAAPHLANAPASSDPDPLAFLASGTNGVPGAFAHPASVPVMPWIAAPRYGWIAGVVTPPADRVKVTVRRTGFSWFRRARAVWTDGNGFFGLTNVKPGRYRIRVDEPNAPVSEVSVSAGKVATVTDLPHKR